MSKNSPVYINVPVVTAHDLYGHNEPWQTVGYKNIEVPSGFTIEFIKNFTLSVSRYNIFFYYSGKTHKVSIEVFYESLIGFQSHEELCDTLLKPHVVAYLDANFPEYDHVLNSYWSVSTPVETTTILNQEAKTDVTPVSWWARRLPGIAAKVKTECACSFSSYETTLYEAIIHLNDDCQWSREKIADWIDDLHDKGIINAEFQEWDEDARAPEGWQEPQGNEYSLGSIEYDFNGISQKFAKFSLANQDLAAGVKFTVENFNKLTNEMEQNSESDED